MDAASLYFWFSLVGLGCTATALIPANKLGPATVFYFVAGWLTSELALFHVAWQAAVTLMFALNGALADTLGVVGLGLTFASWAGLGVVHHRALRSGESLDQALDEALGEGHREQIPFDRESLLRDDVPFSVVSKPFSFARPGVETIRGLAFGDAGVRNELDIIRPIGATGPHPTLLQIHGGAWTISRKEDQAQPLMRHLAERGWVCAAINYRLGPKHRFPDMLLDCKLALAWLRREGPAYGVDPDFIAATGGSAGGHLTALTALTANDPALQPGFEDVDTRVQAAVPFYGVYDFLDQKQQGANVARGDFLERVVMPASAEEAPELWQLASPISQVRADAPPFFVIHGSHDTLAPVEDARFFVEALRSVSDAPVAYAELYGAQHAFDIFHSVRSTYAVNAATRFLEWSYARPRAT